MCVGRIIVAYWAYAVRRGEVFINILFCSTVTTLVGEVTIVIDLVINAVINIAGIDVIVIINVFIGI